MAAAQRLLAALSRCFGVFALLAMASLFLAAADAKPVAPVGASGKKLAAAVEQVIVADSASWLFKVYKPGSVRDVTVEPGDEPGVKIVGANYSYADGSSTWIKVVVRQGAGVQCIAYGDEYFTGCRAVGDNPAVGLIVGAIESGATTPRETATCPPGYIVFSAGVGAEEKCVRP